MTPPHIATITAPIVVNGLHRACFRDPTVVGAVAHHMKTLSVPFEVERQFGYSPEPQKWWRPPAHIMEKLEQTGAAAPHDDIRGVQ